MLLSVAEFQMIQTIQASWGIYYQVTFSKRQFKSNITICLWILERLKIKHSACVSIQETLYESQVKLRLI